MISFLCSYFLPERCFRMSPFMINLFCILAWLLIGIHHLRRTKNWPLQNQSENRTGHLPSDIPELRHRPNYATPHDVLYVLLIVLPYISIVLVLKLCLFRSSILRILYTILILSIIKRTHLYTHVLNTCTSIHKGTVHTTVRFCFNMHAYCIFWIFTYLGWSPPETRCWAETEKNIFVIKI